MVNQCAELLSFISKQGNANKNHLNYHYTSTRLVEIKHLTIRV